MARGDGETPCYTGACSVCRAVVAVTVAPVEEPDTMRAALKSRREWERGGLMAGTCTVDDVRTGRVALGHADGCVMNRRAKRKATTKQAALAF
jgi:hypothetical protein